MAGRVGQVGPTYAQTNASASPLVISSAYSCYGRFDDLDRDPIAL